MLEARCWRLGGGGLGEMTGGAGLDKTRCLKLHMAIITWASNRAGWRRFGKSLWECGLGSWLGRSRDARGPHERLETQKKLAGCSWQS